VTKRFDETKRETSKETKSRKKPAQHIASEVAVNFEREREKHRPAGHTEFRSGILLTNVATDITAVFTCEGKQGSVDAECLN